MLAASQLGYLWVFTNDLKVVAGPYDGHDVSSIDWNSDGSRLAAAGNSLFILDIADFSNPLQIALDDEKHAYWVVTWSPDGCRLATISVESDDANAWHYRVRIWDIATGESVLILTPEPQLGDYRGELDWSPDSTKLAFIGKKYKHDDMVIYPIYVFDAITAKLLETLENSSEANSLVWHSDGELAVARSNDIIIYDTDFDKVSKVISTNTFSRFDWNPDGQKFVVSTPYSDENHVSIIDITSGEVTPLLDNDNLNYVAWNPVNDFIAVTEFTIVDRENDKLQVWDVSKLPEIKLFAEVSRADLPY